MAALSQTAANVAASTGPTAEVTYGGTITAGMLLYRDTDNELKAGSNAASASAQIEGMALNGGGDGQPGKIARAGAYVNVGATTTKGTVYVLGTSGAIVPYADLVGSEYICWAFIGSGTAVVKLILNAEEGLQA